MIPPVALTCGDPNGVGLDLAFDAATALAGKVVFFMIADERHVAMRAKERAYQVISMPSHAHNLSSGTLPILHHKFTHLPNLQGIQLENASNIISVIDRAVGMVQKGDACALTTNPIHKKVLQDGANFTFPGHTEYLAYLSQVKNTVMMLACDDLRVVPTTIHIPLSDVSKQLTKDLLLNTIMITAQAMSDYFSLPCPRIAIAGLNPHAGESGAFGDEEINIIAPVMARCHEKGLDVKGIFSPDTLFHSDARKKYDVAICMYHDQALIPIKTLDFYGGVNITLGLPFIRTSPDHGTAFDLAGGRKANPKSLINALTRAYTMAKTRRSLGDK